MNEELLTTKQLSSKLNINRLTISSWIKKGMPCLKLGKRIYRYDLNKVLEWHETRENIKAINDKSSTTESPTS